MKSSHKVVSYFAYTLMELSSVFSPRPFQEVHKVKIFVTITPIHYLPPFTLILSQVCCGVFQMLHDVDIDIALMANGMSVCIFLFLILISLNFRYGKYQ